MKRCCLFLMPFVLYGCMLSDHHTTVERRSYHKDVIDTALFFPADYLKTAEDSVEYRDLSKLLQAFHEQPLQEYANGSPVIRFYYSGWFRAPLIIRIDNKQVVIKSVRFGQPGLETHYDSMALTIQERKELNDYFRYSKLFRSESADTAALLKEYPNLTNKKYRDYIFTLRGKQEVPDADHFIYTQTTFTNRPDKFYALVNYADTTVFWETSGLTPSGGSADGVGWNVEIIQNGKYNHIQVWSPDHGSFYNLCLQILHHAKLEEDRPR